MDRKFKLTAEQRRKNRERLARHRDAHNGMTAKEEREFDKAEAIEHQAEFDAMRIRRVLYFLGESSPCQNAVTANDDLAITREFARALTLLDIQPEETLKEFARRLHTTWKTAPYAFNRALQTFDKSVQFEVGTFDDTWVEPDGVINYDLPELPSIPVPELAPKQDLRTEQQNFQKEVQLELDRLNVKVLFPSYSTVLEAAVEHFLSGETIDQELAERSITALDEYLRSLGRKDRNDLPHAIAWSPIGRKILVYKGVTLPDHDNVNPETLAERRRIGAFQQFIESQRQQALEVQRSIVEKPWNSQ